MTVESDSSPAVGGSAWPPGFRFHPTDEELVLYYLKRKICRKKLRLNIIAELDVYKWDPEELPGHSLLKTGDRQWYFFSARDRKYPNGARSNRATRQGYWKATGKDRIITANSRSVGLKKTLVFYKGRAPSGQRTDWVMHEYTLDEEEFMRCQNVKDYYALYKVYKKSGPGPKNGEQYGAPFREEEWADDETDILKSTGLEIHPPDIPEVTSFDNITENNNFQPPPDDLEDLLNELFVPEPEFEQALLDDAGPVPVPSLPVNEPVQSSLIVPSAPEVFSEPVNLLSSIPQYDLSESIDWTLSGISGYQQSEASVVTFAPQNYTLEDQSSGDFLEIYDLLGPEPSLDTVEEPVEKFSFDEVTGLSELDQFHDANMFLRDIGPMDQGINDVNLLDYGMENQCNYQLQQSLLLPADPGISQLWALDQRNNDVFSSVESVQGYQHCPSGFVNASSSLLNDATRNQNGVEATGPMSRFSSAVWSFVESIPTNPASASESALVNRALERMSSFSRVRINSMSSNVGAVSGAAVVRSRKSRGFIFFYVVGVLGALLGVLVGFLRLWQRSVPA